MFTIIPKTYDKTFNYEKYIVDILSELYAHKIDDIKEYFPLHSDEAAINSSIRYLKDNNIISVKDNIASIAGSCTDDVIDIQNRLKKPLQAFRWLLNLNDNGNYIYENSFIGVQVGNVYAYKHLLIQRDVGILYIMYVRNNDIINFNLITNAGDEKDGISEESVKRIVVVDNDTDIEQIQIRGLANIISVDDNGTINILR